MNLNVLAVYRSFLADERSSFLEGQFSSFVEQYKLPNNAKLRRSFIRLMDVLDDNHTEWNKVLDKVYTNNFLFDVLLSLPDAKERDLKKTTQAVCNFIQSAGTGNRRFHRAIRETYVDSVCSALGEVNIDATLRKSPDFKSIWTGDLKERLNTKRDK